MIVTGMQPYFFPYIGYFQLLECSDIFVIGDDMNYIKKGWVNRNRILINHEPGWLIFPVQGVSGDLPINQRFYVEDQKERNKLLHRIECGYRKAPYFIDIYPVIMAIMNFSSNNISEFNTNAIRRLSALLEIKCQIVVSSELKKNNLMNGQDRVIEINRSVGSSHFINPIGGASLYREQDFAEHGLKLSFIKPENIEYPQFTESFSPFLSIIDVLMFNGVSGTSKLLAKYHLIKPEDSKNG